MKIHRFYVGGDVSTGAVTVTDPEFVNQVKYVLKLAVGEPIILFNGTGSEAVGNIAGIEKKGVTIEISELRRSAVEPERDIRLYLAILKNEHFELAAQKAVECGVSEIIPVITSRTIKLSLKPERVMKIMREAAEQSGRSVIPRLTEVMKFEDALAAAKHNTRNLFYDSSGQKIEKLQSSVSRLGIWIGPEGGFTAEEVFTARKTGFEIASLGSLVLRAETAAIVATYCAAQL
jgi:16S rRNA (uracil1498-N3)-methyltransferase